MKNLGNFIAFALAFGLFLTNVGHNETLRWYFKRQEGKPPLAGQDNIDLRAYNAYYLGDTDQKELYLTFDEGYENGFTAVILDTLRDKAVPAAFFVTKTYIRDNPELIVRMVDEGHIVANHTVRHLSSPSLSSDELKDELVQTAEGFKELTGVDMPPFFRPPMGQYSIRVLDDVMSIGYKTVFWSFAYEDWIPDKQPGAEVAHNKVVKGLHNGAILLLHAVSESNAQALGDIIDSARDLGYEFKPLYDLP